MGILCFAIGQCLFHSSRSTEINDDIALAVQLIQTVVYGDAVLLTVLLVDPGDHAAVTPVCNHLAEGVTHPAANALNDNICHFCFLVFCCNGKCPGETNSTGHCALFRLFPNQTFGLQCLLDLLLVGITGLDQRQTAGTGLPAQHIHGVLDRDGIYFAEECIRQG